METTDELIARLKKQLDNIILLLERDGNTDRWLQTMKGARQGLEFSDLYGIEILLRSYGGMGSFNDLLIGQKHNANGQFIGWKNESDEKNDILNLLRSDAYDVANQIKRRMENGK